MHPAQIKAALEMRDTRLVDIAKQCGGVTRGTVTRVVRGQSRSQRIEKRIAATIGLPLAEIWPQWYGPKAKRRRALSA